MFSLNDFPSKLVIVVFAEQTEINIAIVGVYFQRHIDPHLVYREHLDWIESSVCVHIKGNMSVWPIDVILHGVCACVCVCVCVCVCRYNYSWLLALKALTCSASLREGRAFSN